MALGKRKGKEVTRVTKRFKTMNFTATPSRARKRRASNLRTGGFLGIENKFVDYTYSDNIVGTNTGAESDPTTADSISAISQGDGESNRDGRKAVITMAQVRGIVKWKQEVNQTAMGAGEIAVVALVLDTQTNGSQLNSEDVYLTATNVALAWRNIQFSKRFRVLKYQQFVFSAPNSSYDGTNIETGGQARTFTWNVKMTVPMNFSGTTAVVGNMVDNSLHVVAFASNSTRFTLAYESRCRFVG